MQVALCESLNWVHKQREVCVCHLHGFCAKLIVCMCRKGIQLKSKLQSTGTQSSVTWPFCHLCYRPVVFFRHLSHIICDSPQGKKFHVSHYYNVIAWVITCCEWLSLSMPDFTLLLLVLLLQKPTPLPPLLLLPPPRAPLLLLPPKPLSPTTPQSSN